MITSTQITNTEILTFTTALVSMLLSSKVLFVDIIDNRIC